MSDNARRPLNPEPEEECDTYDARKGSSVLELATQAEPEGIRQTILEEKMPTKTWERDPWSTDVSSAELADSRQRLQNIGNAARRITSGLGGSAEEASGDL